MNDRARHDRTIRLLTARLEAISLASRAAPGRSGAVARSLVEPSLLQAATATRNAVVLELISADEARAIWAAAAERDPSLRPPRDAAPQGDRQLAAQRTAEPARQGERQLAAQRPSRRRQAAELQPAEPAYPTEKLHPSADVQPAEPESPRRAA